MWWVVIVFFFVIMGGGIGLGLIVQVQIGFVFFMIFGGLVVVYDVGFGVFIGVLMLFGIVDDVLLEVLLLIQFLVCLLGLWFGMLCGNFVWLYLQWMVYLLFLVGDDMRFISWFKVNWECLVVMGVMGIVVCVNIGSDFLCICVFSGGLFMVLVLVVWLGEQLMVFGVFVVLLLILLDGCII